MKGAPSAYFRSLTPDPKYLNEALNQLSTLLTQSLNLLPPPAAPQGGGLTPDSGGSRHVAAPRGSGPQSRHQPPEVHIPKRITPDRAKVIPQFLDGRMISGPYQIA